MGMVHKALPFVRAEIVCPCITVPLDGDTTAFPQWPGGPFSVAGCSELWQK